MAASSPPLAPTGRASDGQIAAAAAAAARCASIPSLADAEFQPPGASVAGSRSRPRASTAPLDDEPRGAAWREAVWATLASPRRSRSTDIGEMLADEGAAAPAPQPGRNYHYRSTSALTRSASGKLSRFKRSVSHLSPSTLNLFSPGSADAAPGTGSFYPRTWKGSAELRDCRENIVKDAERRTIPLHSPECVMPPELTLKDIFGGEPGPVRADHPEGAENSQVDPLIPLISAANWYAVAREGVSSCRSAAASQARDLTADVQPLVFRLRKSAAAGERSSSTEVPSGTLEDLVYQMIVYPDSGFALVDVILATYRLFATGEELCSLLLSWFHAKTDSTSAEEGRSYFARNAVAIRSRTVRIICRWVVKYWAEDFLPDRTLETTVVSFAKGLKDIDEHYVDHVRLQDAINTQTMLVLGQTYVTPVAQVPSTAESVVHADPKRKLVLSVDPGAIAAQLSLAEQRVYSNVRPAGALALVSLPRQDQAGLRDSRLRPLFEYASWFRRVAMWVTGSICQEPAVKSRAFVIKRFVKIAKRCLDLRNYGSTASILYGLKRPVIMQMAGAWKLLEPKHLLMFREIDRLLHPGDNYSNYRDRWSRALDSGSAAAPPGERGDGTDPAAKSGDAAPPSIPFLAAHIQLIWAIWSDPPPVDAGIVDGGRLAAVHRVVERLERERRHDWRASVPEDATANLLAHIDSVRPDTAETPAAAPSAAAAGGGGGFGASRRFGSALLLSAAGRAGKT